MPRWPTSTPLPGAAKSLQRLGLGGMPLSISVRPDPAEARALIRHAVESGVELIDTADSYARDDRETGHNERLIADALREMDMDPAAGLEEAVPIVATKGGRTRPGGEWAINGRPEHLRQACHASLEALGVDRIPLYQLHTPDPDVPFEESVGALVQLRDEGKIGLIGLSNVSLKQMDTASALTPIASVQNRLSVWDAGLRKPPVVARCAAQGILFMAYAPLGGRERAGSLGDVGPLAALAESLRVTPQELALAWLFDLDPAIVPIPGATRTSSIDSGLRALRLELEPHHIRDLRRALRQMPDRKGVATRIASKVRRALD
ncbi:MAG: aldo/keto reductase [Gemmatimonadota bacterium]|nr:aldo/keto reductase [Gemmatimonadota bacterium]